MHMNMELLRCENVKVVRNAKAGWAKELTIVNHYCGWRIASEKCREVQNCQRSGNKGAYKPSSCTVLS